MNMFIVVIVILIWLTLIIIGNATKEKEVEVSPEKPKVKEEFEPEVFLEPISDEYIICILPGLFQKDNKFVSTSLTYSSDLEEKSLKSNLKKVLRPRVDLSYTLPWRIYERYKGRNIYDTRIRLQATYFDKSFNFKTVNIFLKIQDVGYTCCTPDSNNDLAELKKFLTTSPTKMSQENYEFFAEKLNELERTEQDEKVKEFVEQVFDRHISYNEEAERYGTEKAIPITSPEIFFNFCDLVSYRVPSSLKSEITNYLYILCEN